MYENKAKTSSVISKTNWKLSKPITSDKIFGPSKLLSLLITASVSMLLAYISVILIVANEANNIKSIQEMYFAIH